MGRRDERHNANTKTPHPAPTQSILLRNGQHDRENELEANSGVSVAEKSHHSFFTPKCLYQRFEKIAK